MKNKILPVVFSIFTTLLIFSFLEAGARFFHYLKPHLNEYERVIENQGVLPSNKLPGEKRIFVLGESAVEGIPYSREMSFTGFMSQIAEKSNLSKIRFINLGVKGRHSFYQREIAGVFSKYKADAVILYAGNNDTRDFSNVIRDLPGAWLDFMLTWHSSFYAGLKRKISHIQEIANEKSRQHLFDINHNSDDSWHWTNAYIRKKTDYMENPEHGLKRKAIALQDYEDNLSALVKKLKSKGIPVYICSLGINHKNIPAISDIKRGLGPHGKGYEIFYQNSFSNPTDKISWNELFETGQKLLLKKEYSQALMSFQKAAQITPLHPHLAYDQGECYEGLGKFEEAKKMYLLAKKLEIQSPGGSNSKNNALKRIALKFHTEWIPIQETLESLTPSGIVGSDVFLDHCHYNLYGHKVVAARIMKSLCQTGLINCPAAFLNWADIFSIISQGKLDAKNLSNEHLMTAFYMINGTPWQTEPQYQDALIYLEKAYALNPGNEKIYPLLGETYLALGKKQEADKFLEKAKSSKMIHP